MIDMNVSCNNERKVIDTRLENESLVLVGKAEFIENSVYLHGRILYGGKYAGQYNDMMINLMKNYHRLKTEVSTAIDELRDYIINNKV